MAEVVSLKLSQPPGGGSSGSSGDRISLEFECEVDVQMPGVAVIQLAQELVGSLPSSNPDGTAVTEVPNPGNRFFWSSDPPYLIDDTYSLVSGTAGAAAFLADGTVTGTKYYDVGILAQDFEAELISDCNRVWRISCTFRKPQPGMNETRPQLSQIYAGRDGFNPSQPIDYDGSDVERWVEQRFMKIPTGEAYLVNAGIPANTKTPMIMPNGEEYPPFEMDMNVDVLVIARNIETEEVATILNKTYRNTFNSAVVNFGGRTADPYTAVYESTRTGRPIEQNSSVYYRAETRIVLYEEPRFAVRQAYGTYYLNNATGKRKKLTGEDGLPLPRVPLDANGELAPPGSPVTRVYTHLKKADYSQFAYT